MNKEEIGYAIERIEHLEKTFDYVSNTFKKDKNCVNDEVFSKKVSLLNQYLESGQWLRDFSLDEKGELPKDLKRGILSEDGLYNLLCEIDKAKNKKCKFCEFFKNIFK